MPSPPSSSSPKSSGSPKSPGGASVTFSRALLTSAKSFLSSPSAGGARRHDDEQDGDAKEDGEIDGEDLDGEEAEEEFEQDPDLESSEGDYEASEDDMYFSTAEPAGTDVEMIRPPMDVREVYTFVELVYDSGEGRRVHLCEERTQRGDQEPRRCMVKVWQKSAMTEDESDAWLEVQLQLLRMPRHANLAQPCRIREDDQAFYLEFDVVLVGCSLLQALLNDSSTTDRQMRHMVHGILAGLRHLHQHGLAHRDVKPENVLLGWRNAADLVSRGCPQPNGWPSSKRGISRWRPAARFKAAVARHALTVTVNVIDLDTVSGPQSTVICGTPGYMAPEAYSGNAGPPGDLFAVGVILYMMVQCKAPFHDVVHKVLRGQRLDEVPPETRKQVAQAVRRRAEQLSWDGELWDSLAMARDLCRKLLAPEPGDRGAHAEEVLSTAAWFQGAVASPLGTSPTQYLTGPSEA